MIKHLGYDNLTKATVQYSMQIENNVITDFESIQ